MAKFVLIFCGFEEPTPKVMEAWGSWFASIGDRFVDQGSPIRSSREITREGTSTDLTPGVGAATGYCIVEADSMDDAEKLLAGCPIIDSVRIYETMSMERGH